jgi:hypothetical protein|nr:MAG TPA: hypothetical protein [Bacteriophage sp.]
MNYIGDYNADTWMIVEKIYNNNILIGCYTTVLSLKEYKDVCQHIKMIVGTYREDFDTIKHPMKSVYVLENSNCKLIVKAIKI